VEKVYVPKHPYKFDNGVVVLTRAECSCVRRGEKVVGWATAGCSRGDGAGSIDIRDIIGQKTVTSPGIGYFRTSERTRRWYCMIVSS